MINVGDIVLFGCYDQKCIEDFVFLNEPIEWIVLEVQEKEVILLALKGLEGIRYDLWSSYRGWEHSFLREYLNGEFIESVFSTS